MSDRAQTEPGYRVCPHNNLLIEAFGISGKNGRVGTLEKKVDRLENIALKLILSSCAGGGIVAIAIKLLFNGGN